MITRPQSRRAFTLIELLVVIAIIAILAAILFPVFATARDKARQASCISNVKQINLAILQYVQDYDETFPLNATEYVGEQFIYDYSWVKNVQPYVKSLQVFICPNGMMSPRLSSADVEPSLDVTLSGAVGVTTRPRGGPIVSYGMTSRSLYWLGAPMDVGEAAFFQEEYNGRTALYDGVGGMTFDPASPKACGGAAYKVDSLTNAAIVRPAEMILLQESSRYDNGGCTGFVAFPRTRHASAANVVSPVPLAGTIGTGFATVGFVDGHVKAMKGSQMYAVINDPAGNYFRHYYPAK